MKGCKKNVRPSSSEWFLGPEHTIDSEKQHYVLRTSAIIRVSTPQISTELLFMLCMGKSYYLDKLLTILRAGAMLNISLISRAPRIITGKKADPKHRMSLAKVTMRLIRGDLFLYKVCRLADLECFIKANHHST